MPTPSAFQKPQYAASKGIIRNPGAILHGAPQDDNGQGFVKQIEKSSNVVDLSTIVHKKIGGIHPQLVGKARLRRSFPTKRVSPALSARPGKRAGKPCCARLPNPPHMSLDSGYSSEGRGPPNLPEGFFDSLRAYALSLFEIIRR